MSTTKYETAGVYSWNWPGGQTLALVEVWGAGGGGGTPTSLLGAGGGGGGGHARATIVKTAATLDVTVGAGGGQEVDGGNSIVSQSATQLATATGGTGAVGTVAGGYGSGTVGVLLTHGGNGASNSGGGMFGPSPGTGGCGGGSSSGCSVDGNGGGSSSGDFKGGGGTAPPCGKAGGNGGNGVPRSDPAEDGEDGHGRGAGGGGGAAGRSSGSGSDGFIRITSPPPPKSRFCCCDTAPIITTCQEFRDCFEAVSNGAGGYTIPYYFELEIAGITDGLCGTCSVLNATYLYGSPITGYTFSPCEGAGSLPNEAATCSDLYTPQWHISLDLITADIGTLGGVNDIAWQYTGNIGDLCGGGEIVLPWLSPDFGTNCIGTASTAIFRAIHI